MEVKTTLLGLCRRYYAFNGTGGNLHIMLDDGNVSLTHLAFCENKCYEHDDSMGLFIISIMWDMSEEDRKKFVDAYGYGYKHA